MAKELTNITNLRKKYPNKSNDDFRSLEEYYEITIKNIYLDAEKIQRGLSKRILADEDAIANIAHKLMMGDWRWQEDGGRNRNSYLRECCKWALREYVRREAIHKLKSQDESVDPNTFNWRKDYAPGSDYVSRMNETTKDPLEILIEREEEEQNYLLADKLIANSGLTLLEEACIRAYNDSQDFQEVSESLNISKGYAKTVYNKATRKVIERNV